MSYTSLLIHTCTVRRYTEGVRDGYGKPADTWFNHLTDEPCRLEIALRPGNELKIGLEIVVAEYQLFMGDVDIIERDEIILDSLTYEILLVKTFSDGLGVHHKQLMLRTSR